MIQLQYIKEWITARVAERTSWDGVSIIAISVAVLVASPLVKWIAWAGLAYGAYHFNKGTIEWHNHLNSFKAICLETR